MRIPGASCMGPAGYGKAFVHFGYDFVHIAAPIGAAGPLLPVSALALVTQGETEVTSTFNRCEIEVEPK